MDVRVDADAGTTGTELGEHDTIGTTGSNGGTVSVDQHELLDSKKKVSTGIEFKQQTQVQQRLIDQLNAVFPGLTGPLEKELLSKFNDLGELTENVFLRNSSLILQPGSDGVFEIAPDAVGDALQQLKLSEWKRDNLGPVLEKHTAEVIDSTVDAIGNVVNIAINVPDYVARELIRDGGKRVGLIDVIGDTKKAMFRALEEGRELGEGADAVARRIRRYVPEGRFRNAGKNYRAKMIARTETKWSQNESSLRAYEQSSDITHVVAFDAQLGADRSDPDCIARNGREFTIAGARAEMGKEHPNGTLSFAPVVKPGAARTRASGELGVDGPFGPVADNQPLSSPLRVRNRTFHVDIPQNNYALRPQSGAEARARIATIDDAAKPVFQQLDDEIVQARQAWFDRYHEMSDSLWDDLIGGRVDIDEFTRRHDEVLSLIDSQRQNYYDLLDQYDDLKEVVKDTMVQSIEHGGVWSKANMGNIRKVATSN